MCVRQFVPSLQDGPQVFAEALELASELGVSLLGLSGSSSCGSLEHEPWDDLSLTSPGQSRSGDTDLAVFATDVCSLSTAAECDKKTQGEES